MHTFLSTASTVLLLAVVAPAQNAEFSFVHGIPGLSGAVDVAVDGTTVFSGVNFGELSSTTIAPGFHVIDVLDGASVLLSTSTTTAADESFTAAAHLLVGGAANLAVFQNDLSATTFVGDGRLTVRHLANAGPVFFGLESPTSLILSGAINGSELLAETPAEVFSLSVAEIGTSLPFPFPPSAQLAQGLALAADAGVIVHIVGVPGTASFSAIVQDVTLDSATPINPSACDLTLSGSFVGGSISVGGDVTYAVTGATPNSFVAVFLALDDTPFSFFNVPLGIGGGGGLDVVVFGLSDGNGDFSQTLTYPPSTVVGIPGPTFFFDFFVQAASGNFAPGGFLTTSLSDIEVLQISVP